MRHVITLMSVFVFISSNAQNFEPNPNYLRNLSSFNPAISGFYSKAFFNFQGQQNTEYSGENPYALSAVSDVKVKGLHGGLGINYNHFDNVRSKSNTLKFNYNYQMQLSENQRLSLGLSAGIDQVAVDAQGVDYFNNDGRLFSAITWDPTKYLEAEASQKTSFTGGLGMVYRFKQIEFGASANHFLDYQLQRTEPEIHVVKYQWGYTDNLLYNFHVNYQFNIFKGLEMNPVLSFQGLNAGYSFFATHLNFIVMERVNFGIQLNNTLENTTQAWFFMGLRIKERLNLNYSYGAKVSLYTNGAITTNMIGLNYSIN